MARAPKSPGPKPERRGSEATSDLEARIAKAQKERSGAKAVEAFRQREMTGFGRAFRFAAEFVAAIVVGAVLGYIVDSFLGTSPWATIGLLLLGFAAGVLNVVRAAQEMNSETSESELAAMPVIEDEEE